MSDETPGNAAGASTSTAPSGSSSATSNSGVAATPEASSPPASTASPPATSPESSTGTGEASGGEAFDFSAIFDAPSEIPPAPAKPAEVVAPPAKPPTAPEVPPASPPAAPVEAPPAPAAAKPVEPTPAPAAPQADTLDPYDPSSLSRHLAANEAAAVQFTAENMFKLTPEEVEALETNMVEAVPKLMAKAFVKSQLNALEQMSRLVPAMIQRQTAILKQNSDNESKFYARWPDIKQAQHEGLVRKYAAVYKQMHPNTTLEQMIEDLGPMVMMAARVVPQPPVSHASATNGRGPPPPPFVPAGAGATNTSKAVELNPVEVMFQDHG
jgi:hemolysin-activating ACP:hemolysin acyltransferase